MHVLVGAKTFDELASANYPNLSLLKRSFERAGCIVASFPWDERAMWKKLGLTVGDWTSL